MPPLLNVPPLARVTTKLRLPPERIEVLITPTPLAGSCSYYTSTMRSHLHSRAASQGPTLLRVTFQKEQDQVSIKFFTYMDSVECRFPTTTNTRSLRFIIQESTHKIGLRTTNHPLLCLTGFFRRPRPHSHFPKSCC